MRSRHDSIAAFYATKAADLEGAVRRAVTGPDALIEDACSHAWCQLLCSDQVCLDDHGFGWLYVVALREAYRLSDRSRREPPIGQPGDLPVCTSGGNDPATTVERQADAHERLAPLAELPRRRAAMVYLHASGFSYQEIARLTGASLRTVERQLLRGKRTLRQRDRERIA